MPGLMMPGLKSKLRRGDPVERLSHFLLDELHDEVDEFVHAFGEFFFDVGEVVGLGFAVVAAVLGTGFAPAAGVEGIDEGGCTDELEGVDDPLVVHSALPKLMKAVLALKDGNGLVDIHESAFLAGESPFR